MPDFDPIYALLAVVGLLALVVFGPMLLRMFRNAGSDEPRQPKVPPQSDPRFEGVHHLVICGIDFSRSMHRHTADFVEAFRLFREEQLVLPTIRFWLYRVTGTVTRLSNDFLSPESLPVWTAEQFQQMIGPGTAINSFMIKASNKLDYCTIRGFHGRVEVILFTDGAFDEADAALLPSGREAIKRLKAQGVPVKIFAFVDSSQFPSLLETAHRLGLKCNAQKLDDPANEVVIYDIAKCGIAKAVHDASQIVRLADLQSAAGSPE